MALPTKPYQLDAAEANFFSRAVIAELGDDQLLHEYDRALHRHGVALAERLRLNDDDPTPTARTRAVCGDIRAEILRRMRRD